MEIKKELERQIEKYKDKPVATFETRIDLLAEDCLKHIEYLESIIDFHRKWTPISESKPKTDERVFLTVKRKSHFSDEMFYKVIIGCYFAPYEYEADNWHDFDPYFCDYDEDNDTYYIKEGWYECSEFGEEYSYFDIDDGWKITHWKPMIEPERGESR